MTRAFPNPAVPSAVSRLTLVPAPEPLDSRERRVLQLVADGCSTREVALRMNYSERTIKNVLHALTERHEFRNRTHAVAAALRAGWI